MKKSRLLPLAVSLLISGIVPLGAQQLRVFDNAGGDSLWSNTANWQGGDVPDSNGEYARIQGNPIVDQNFTINYIQNAFGSGNLTTSSSGGGVLTIDRNTGTAGNGILNVTGNAGSNLMFSGNLTINNSQGGVSWLNFGNSNGNGITFTDTSVLTLTTQTEVLTGSSGRYVNFNGSIAGGTNGSANLRLGSNNSNITFGATADNTGYLGDFVTFGNTSVVSDSTVAGGFLDSGSKLQVNGTGSSLTLNGANGMAGNLVVDGANVFTLNVNANQDAFGILTFSGASPSGQIGINLDSGVSSLHFADSSGFGWGSGTVSITGFKENTIRFGTDANGLTSQQLSAIDGGAYSLTNDGFLTIPEPGTLVLMLVSGLGLLLFRRRR